MTKEALITKLKILYAIHNKKTKEHQQQNNLSEECGCITKESIVIASLYPKMIQFGITDKDLQ